MVAWDSKWREIQEIEQWTIFKTVRADNRFHSTWTYVDEVPDGEQFRAEMMQIARGDDRLFDRYMYEFDIVETYRRAAHRLAGYEYRPEE